MNYTTVILNKAIIACLSCMIMLSCNDGEDATPVKPVEGELSILPLGDSRVEGARPLFESYRFELWKNLVAANFDVDLTGPEDDEATYPQFMGLNFDNDHAGIGGDRTSDVLRRLDNVLASSPTPPDIVLLGIGGNDLLESNLQVSEIIQNVNTIIDRLQNSNDSITIFLEQIAPGRSDINTPQILIDFNEFNRQILNVAETKTDATSMVVAVNMFEGWRDEYMADEVHYNEVGAKVVADKYFESISNLFGP